MEYKGYIGIFTFDETLELFQGKVSNSSYPITFHGKSIESLKYNFKDAVNDYLVWCKKTGKTPEKPSKEKNSQESEI